MKFKSILLLIVALSLLLCACNDTTITTEPEGVLSPSPSEQEAAPSISASASESPSEPVTFPRLVCKEGQWLLETGIREEDLPEPNHFSFAWSVKFDSYEDFVRRIKEVDFTEEQLAYMEPLMVYYYGYQENGALAIPDPALLESFSFPFLQDHPAFGEIGLGRVHWGYGEGICVFSTHPRLDDYVVIHEKDRYNQSFKYLEEEWEKGFFETAKTKEALGLTMYVVDEHTCAYRVETQNFTAWIKREFSSLYLHVKEKNGLNYTYRPDSNTSDVNVLKQIKAVFEKYGYELGK
ncbi:MAG: hypothetical protein IJX59_08505 [Clostridia bacterium]|nr:hypothetical protein [Clostridia bacterium]